MVNCDQGNSALNFFLANGGKKGLTHHLHF